MTDVKQLEKKILMTLEQECLDPHKVIAACDTLSQRIISGQYDRMIKEAGLERIAEEKAGEAAFLLSRQAMVHKLTTELGTEWERCGRYPLGVLFHIGAGNLDGLSAYSVVEGLLTGNVNLLKLPEAERGISEFLLKELVEIEPVLAPYLFVFHLSSADTDGMTRLAALADGIVVWGGDEAIKAVRVMAKPGTRLIEWGHKLSFAYVTRDGAEEEQLKGLARHMVETRQLLCSSCQGIYLDTEDVEELDRFSRRFLLLLEQAAAGQDMGLAALNTLKAYTRQLESVQAMGVKVYRGHGVSVVRELNQELELSMLNGCCWVKPLPKKQIIRVLRRKKEYLQTAGLLCAGKEWEELAGLLCRAGVVRVRKGADMSKLFAGEAHDGEYPLIRYSRIVEL